VRVDPLGIAGPTRAQARGRSWRRTSQGFYVPADVDDSLPEQRIVEAAHDLRGCASVTGWAALRWMGAEWFSGYAADGVTKLPVVIAVRHGALRSQPGIAVTSEFIPPRDRTVVDGLLVTIPVCAVAWEMRYAHGVRAAVQALDMAAAADLVSIREMLDHAEWLYHWIGIPQCREALALADENSWSPQETGMRLVWVVDAQLPPPLTNRPVFDRGGRHIGTPDLIDVEAGVVGEYDGRLHLLGARRARDLRREDAFRAVGLEYFSIVAADRSVPGLVVDRMRATRARALFLPPDQRAWTVDPPRWWVPTHTVEQRRALSPAQKERFLGRRRTA
jgi:hypothetical protein